MQKLWEKHEIEFILNHLEKTPIEIYLLYCDKYSNKRTYDSVQKKVKKIKEQFADTNNASEIVKDTSFKYTLKQEKTLNSYIDVLKILGHKPTISDLENYGITRSILRCRWGNLRRLEKAARLKDKDLFQEIGLSDLITVENKRKLIKVIENNTKFIITTAITGARVDINFLTAIDSYCKANNVELLIMIASDFVYNWSNNDELGYIDNVLHNKFLVTEEIALNNNLYLSCIKLNAKQIDPITGMQQLAQENGSYIFASPKQRLKFVPVPMHKLSPAIMGTGAITLPEYRKDLYASQRTRYLAEHTHKMGAIVVEIQDKDIFHFRQIQANKDGSFVDLGQLYNPDGSIVNISLEALVCGDQHAGRENKKNLNARYELCSQLSPKRIIIHDLFDGLSVSHHIEGKTITKAKRALNQKSILLEELAIVGKTLENYSKLTGEIVVVKSNHDEHLDRYLEEARFIQDSINYRLSLDLAAALYDGFNPIKVAIEKILGFNNLSVVWLKRDESYIVEGVELGYHGDKGPNGALGSIKNIANSIRKSVTAHTHSAEIYGNAWRVGTSTPHLDYCSGTSSWTNTDCLIYKNGAMQLINYIDGKYKI